MSVQTANPRFHFELPNLSYIDAKWEEPGLRAPAANNRPVRGGLGVWIARRMEAFQTWRRNSEAMSELAMMSDYELRDIGISRSDLNRVFEPEFNLDLRQREGAA